MAAPLDVFADLTLDLGDEVVHVRSAGAQIDVDVPSRHALRTLLRAPGIRSRRLRLLRAASRHLQDAGLSAEVRLGGRRIGRLGTYPEAGWIARLLNASVRGRDASEPERAKRHRPAWVLAAGAATGLAALALWLTRRSDS